MGKVTKSTHNLRLYFALIYLSKRKKLRAVLVVYLCNRKAMHKYIKNFPKTITGAVNADRNETTCEDYYPDVGSIFTLISSIFNKR